MDVGKRCSSYSEPFKATKIWNSLVDHLKQRLEPRKRRWKLQIYEGCFRGYDVLEELQNYVYSHPELASDPMKVNVKSLCQFLLENRVFECVSVDLRKDGFENGRLYRFVNTSIENQVTQNTDLTRSCQKAERKKKRRSFEGWGLHSKSSRRKSYHGQGSKREKLACSSPVVNEAESEKENLFHLDLESKRKRRVSFVGSEGVIETNPWVETPRKTRRQSLYDHIMKPKLGSTQDYVPMSRFRDIWFQVALSNLLKFVEAPFLENILLPLETKHSLSTTVFNNSYNDLQNSMNSEDRSNSEGNGGRRGRDSICQKAALECFNAQSQFPLPREECGFQNIMSLTEAAISNSLAEFYGSLSDSLIPANYVDLVTGILDLLKVKRMKVARALQLLIILVPQDRQEHLKRLLNFMEKSLTCRAGIPGKHRMRYICRHFMEGILPNGLADQSIVDSLVSLMITERETLFSIPVDIRLEVNRHLECTKRSRSEPAISYSACRRITPLEYEQQMKSATKEGLRSLMNAIIDDLSLSLRAKGQKLNQFKKHHVEIFREQFPSGQV